MTRVVRAAGALLLLAFSCVVSAQSCDVAAKATAEYAAKQKRGYDDVLTELQRDGCLADRSADSANPWVKRINELTTEKSLDQALQRFAAGRSALLELAGFAERRATNGVQVEIWLSMANQLKSDASRIGAITPETAGDDAVRILNESLAPWLRLDGQTRGEVVLDGRTYRLLQPTGCEQTAMLCPTFDSQVNLVRAFKLAYRVTAYLQYDNLAAHYADAQLQSARWESYRQKALHQYWWELTVNKIRMGRDYCNRDNQTGIERGFCKTPTSQIILLHPEAGLRWSRYAQKSSELKPALVVELIGAYRWEWENEKSSAMKDRFGASLVAAYADERAGKKWSYGPMLHFGDGYNLAITRARGERWSLMINLNLSNWFFGHKQEAVDFLKKLP